MFNKHKLLMVALVMTAVGTLTLTSCNKTGTSGSGESSNEASYIPGIQVSQLTESVVVGTVINLDDYVKYDGGNNYEATLLTTSLATLDGHTLTVTGEGSVKVKIAAGTDSGVFVVNSISQIKKQFDQDTKAAGRNFFFNEIEIDDSNPSQISIYTTNTGALHNDNYFAFYSGDFDETLGDYSKRYYEGVIKTKSTNTYWYTCDDLSGKNLTVDPGKLYQFELYYAASELVSYLSADMFTTVTEKDETNQMVSYLSCKDAARIGDFQNHFVSMYSATQYLAKHPDALNPGYKFEYEELVVEQAEFTIDANTTKTYWMLTDFAYCSYQNQSAPLIWNMYLLDLEEVSMKGLDDYIEAGTEPVALKSDELFVKINDIVNANNYSLKALGYWTDGSDAITGPADAAGLFPTFGYDANITADTVVATSLTDGAIDGYTVKDGKTYEFTNVNENGTVGETVSATENSAAADAYHRIDILNDATLLANANIQKNSLVEDTRYINFPIEGAAQFGLNLLKQVPVIGDKLAEVYAQEIEGLKVIEMFNASSVITDSTLEFTLQVTWDAGTYYCIGLSFSSVGTTDVSEFLASVVYPTVA